MLDPANTEPWITFAGAVITLVAATLGLIVALKRRDSDSLPPIVVLPAPAAGRTPAPPAPPASDDADLPGRPRFINRERQLSDLVSRVRSGHDRVLTIEGERWIGKSAAARELMHALRHAGPAGAFDPWRDWVWFDAHDGCPTMADICGRLSLETDDQALASAAEQAKVEKLRRHLGSSRTVLVLDNLSLADDPPSRSMIDFLSDLPNGSLVIASLNRPAGLDASRVELRDLDADDVYKLIEDRVHRLSLDGGEQFDRAFAHRLHRLLGGNPGVIEWFLRGYRDSTDTLEERIAAIEAGRELSALFGPTWNALGATCRAALEACAYLGGEATGQQLEIACDLPEPAIRAAVDTLRREGLLTPLRARGLPTLLTCAPAFQLFVAAQTPHERGRGFAERLADHYIRYFTAQPEDAHYGAGEVGALRVVRGALLDAGDDARLQTLFRATLDILFTLGQYDELIDAAELSYTSAARVENYAGATLAAAMKAGTHAIRGELGYATSALASALDAAASARLPGAWACAKRCDGFVHYRSRRARRALAAIEGAERLAREGGEGVALVDTLDLRTAANWYLRRYDACEAAARASLETGARMHWERARAYPLRYLAELAIQRRQPAQARALLDEARDIADRLGDKRQLARVELTRARMCLLQGELDAGTQAVAWAVSEAGRLGLPPEEEEARAVAGALARARRSRAWRRWYMLRRPSRLTDAPVGGD